MGAFLLLIIGYFVIKNLGPKKETIEELKVLDGSLPENSPAALARQGEIENGQAAAEALQKTLFTPISSITINPAVLPSVIIQSRAEQIIEDLRKESFSIPQPGEICEEITVQNVINLSERFKEISSTSPRPVMLGFIQTGQSVKIYACGKTREERIKRAHQLARDQGYIPLLA